MSNNKSYAEGSGRGRKFDNDRDDRDSFKYNREYERRHREDRPRGSNRGRESYEDRKPYRSKYDDRKSYDDRKLSYNELNRRSQSPHQETPDFKPNFANSGLLAAESKTVNGTVLKYHEPLEAHKPDKKDDWRIFVFEDESQTDMLTLDKQSCYLFGRDTNVADYPIVDASISKQHAVIQFRMLRSKNEFGDVSEQVKPFILDLESTNGTHVNGKEIPVSRFYEVMAGDVLQFGLDKREFVVIKSD